MARLSLRYPPTNQADLDGRAGLLALLAEDLADMPPSLLERAIAIHVRNSPYMPKVSDLLHLAKGLLAAEQRTNNVENARRIAAERNAKLDADQNSIGGRWVADRNGSLSIVPKSSLDRRSERQCTAEQAATIMREFKIPSSSIIGAIARTLGEPRRTPTAAETAELLAEQPRPDDAEMEWRRSMPDEPIPEQRGDEQAEAVG